MKIEAERYLWSRIPEGESVGFYINEIMGDMALLGMIKSPKEVYATLSKWDDQGCWDYGVSLRTGWKTGKIPVRLQGEEK